MPDPKSITCAECGNSTTSAGVLPKFCSHCGARFAPADSDEVSSGSTSYSELDQTIAPSRTVDNIDALATDQTHDSSFVVKGTTPAGKLKPGDQIGPFRLGCQLGSGGMGTVYEAHDTESDRPVALKLLSRQVRASEEGVDRFRRESQVAASINHPGSTFVYRSGQYGEQFFIAMELMNGGTLKDVVETDGPLEVSRAVDFILDTIDGLAVAHEVGIVHRDFKPSNCFLDDDGHAKVGDFGLAKSFYGDVALTQTGAFVGTPQFAAPEQLRAGHVDARTDIYAVAGTLFYLLTGRAPFVGDAAQVIAGIAAEKAPNIKTIAPHVPEKLASLLATMLEKDPARRPSSLKEIRESLLPFSSLGSIPADRGQRMAAFFIDMFAFGFIGFIITMLMSSLSVVLGPEGANRAAAIANVVGIIMWFAVQEYVTGTTIGKWLFRMRVVNGQNDSPKLWQAFVRPLFIPGVRTAIAMLPLMFMTPEDQPVNGPNILTIGIVELIAILSWIPCILFMLTARVSNGYRGLHDQLTDTRVVRISNALKAAHSEQQPVTAPSPIDPDSFSADSLEPFEVLGVVGFNKEKGERILVGRDASLDRKVWIYETNDASPPLLHAGIRPTRQRSIATRVDTSVKPHRHYYVSECIKGLPLVEYLQSNANLQWTTCRPLLRELAAELERAENENSLPNDFNEKSVWLDKSGQLKLVEFAECRNVGEGTSRDVFDSIFAKFVERQPVPEHVIELNQSWQGSSKVSFSEIVDALDEIEDSPSGWSWIDRIGLMSVWLAVEFSILTLLGQLWLTMCNSWTEMTAGWICGLFFFGMSAIGLIIGSAFENPLLWFLGIAVRSRKKLRSASRLQLGLRTFFTWLLPLGMSTSVIGIQATVVTNQPGQVPFYLLFAALLFLLVCILMLFVGLFNLARPARGVADLICGTQLLRK